MMGKRMLALTLALLFALLVFAGCAKNPEDIVGTVGETPIYRWYYEYKLKQQLKGYALYAGVDLTDPAYKKEYKEYKANILNALAGEAAMKEAARAQGLYTLTGEQEADIDHKYLEFYNKAIDALLIEYGTDENGRRKAEQAYNDMLAQSGMTANRMRSVLRDQYVKDLLYASRGLQYVVTEEEMRAYYDEQVIAQTKALGENPASFTESPPDIAIVIPEGYVETARITLKFTQRHQNDLSKAGQALQSAISEYSSAVQKSGEKSIAASMKQTALDRTAKAYDKILNNCYAQLEQSMAPIREKAVAGDFLQVRDVESQDSHKISYYVSADSEEIEESYRNAALALANVGDVSPVVRTQDGVCIISLLSLPGTLPFEEVRTDIENLLLASLQRNLYFIQDEYAEAADEQGIITLYPEKL